MTVFFSIELIFSQLNHLLDRRTYYPHRQQLDLMGLTGVSCDKNILHPLAYQVGYQKNLDLLVKNGRMLRASEGHMVTQGPHRG